LHNSCQQEHIAVIVSEEEESREKLCERDGERQLAQNVIADDELRGFYILVVSAVEKQHLALGKSKWFPYHFSIPHTIPLQKESNNAHIPV
jgi:hypothetical protein